MRINFRIIWLALPLVFGACSDSSDADTRPATETISVSVGSGPKIDIESEDRSRTQLGEDGVSVKWASDDQIALWAVNSRSETVFSKQAFKLYHYNTDYNTAKFRGDIPQMPADTYTYYAVSPVPSESDGTQATYLIPDVQDGGFNGDWDVMVADPVKAPALEKNDTGETVQFQFRHKVHVLKIRIPKNDLGEKVSEITLAFPQPVTGRMTVDAAAISEYRLQGLLPIEKTDYDLWTNSLTLRALVLDPNVTTATFGLRVKDGEWSDAEGVNAGEGIYTATFTAQWKESVNAAGLTVHTPVAGTGVFAGNSYEARAALDGETVSSAEFQAAAGQVIPDGDMESGSLPCFGKSTSESTTFWGSGNAATSGLCAQSTKPGMGGSYCAKLESQPAFGLLAAGNLFSATFRFASLSGTASFGMPYQWTARPTALRLKYHATVGAVNKGTVTEEHEYIQDGQDRSRIFAVIVDWNSRHATVAGMGSPTGVWDPAKTAETAEGPVIAYGSLLIGETTPGDAMTTVEIPIEYYDRTTKPTGAYTLVISCTTSAYGDFKVGCLGNVMYVDDFEWVY